MDLKQNSTFFTQSETERKKNPETIYAALTAYMASSFKTPKYITSEFALLISISL